MSHRLFHPFPDEAGQPCCSAKAIRQASQTNKNSMKQHLKLTLAACVAGLIASSAFVWQLNAADAKEDAIKEVMKSYHKAPKGTDPTCKKAADGKASADELTKLVAGYKLLTTVRPPKGDDASWKEKTGKLLAAAQSLQKGDADGLAKYKEAVNCKACHSVHKPD